MASKLAFPITKSLQDTVKKHDGKTQGGLFRLIPEVYFDADGNHYFNKFKVKIFTVDDRGYAKEKPKDCKEVTSLPGVKRELVKVTQNDGKTVKDQLVNVGYTKIAATISREDILAADTVTDKKSEKEQLEILRQAAEIAKSGDLDALMTKLKSEPKVAA